MVLSHHRRRIVHLAVTEHPTAIWTAQQIIEAFPNDTGPRWLLRDRDAIYGDAFRRRVASMGITEVIISPSSPWQNPYAERLIGSLRRECLDHMIVLGERHLRRLLSAYLAYNHGARTHLGSGRTASSLRTTCGLTGTGDRRPDCDVRLRVCAAFRADSSRIAFVTAIRSGGVGGPATVLARTSRAQSMLRTCRRLVGEHSNVTCLTINHQSDQFLGESRWVTARPPCWFWRTTGWLHNLVC